MEKVTLLGDRILIELDKAETQTESGLVIPKAQEQGEVRSGKVVAAGPGRRTESGELIPIAVAEDDKVLFQYGQNVTVEGKSYILVREEDILAVV